MITKQVIWLAITAISAAREITFPPIAGFQHPLGASSEEFFLQGGGRGAAFDLSHAKYGGLTTYANVPYVHCLAADGVEIETYDIAILGAPFDTVSSIIARWPGQFVAMCLQLLRCATNAFSCTHQGVTARPGARYGPGGIRQGSRRIQSEFSFDVETGKDVGTEFTLTHRSITQRPDRKERF